MRSAYRRTLRTAVKTKAYVIAGYKYCHSRDCACRWSASPSLAHVIGSIQTIVPGAAICMCNAEKMESWLSCINLIVYCINFTCLFLLHPFNCIPKMSLRTPLAHVARRATPGHTAAVLTARDRVPSASWRQSRNMATVVPPVTQDSTSKRGPTAMVFMNMGGPATTDEVGDFLSRLFVSSTSL